MTQAPTAAAGGRGGAPARPAAIATVLAKVAFGASMLIALTGTLACSQPTKQTAILPSPERQHQELAPRAVILLRLAADEDRIAMPAPLAAAPRGKAYFRIALARAGEPTTAGELLIAGVLDPASTQAGWGFLALSPGRYQFAYSGLRTKFSMADAHRGALGRGLSTGYRFDVPAGEGLLYIGTFDLSCRRVDDWFGYFRRECSRLDVRDEREQAREIAAAALQRYGSVTTALATVVATPDQ